MPVGVCQLVLVDSPVCGYTCISPEALLPGHGLFSTPWTIAVTLLRWCHGWLGVAVYSWLCKRQQCCLVWPAGQALAASRPCRLSLPHSRLAAGKFLTLFLLLY